MQTTSVSINAQRAFHDNGSSIVEESSGLLDASSTPRGQTAFAAEFLVPAAAIAGTIESAILRLTMVGDDSSGVTQTRLGSPIGTQDLETTSVFLATLRANSVTINNQASADAYVGGADYEFTTVGANPYFVDITALMKAMQADGGLDGGNIVIIGRVDDVYQSGYYETDSIGLEIDGIGDSAAAVLELDYFEPGLGDELLWVCPSLDDPSNSTAELIDISGNGRTGTLVNMDPETDWVADVASGGVRCLEHDGTNDFVRFGHIPEIAFEHDDAFSVMLWTLIPNDPALQGSLFSQMNTVASFRGWEFFFDNLGSSFRCYHISTFSSNTNFTYALYAYGNPKGAWHHIGLTYDGSGASGYKYWFDAAPMTKAVNYSSLSATAVDTSADARIGSRSNGTSSGFTYPAKMKWDDLRIYGRELSGSEIRHLAKSRGITGAAASGLSLPLINRGLVNRRLLQ